MISRTYLNLELDRAETLILDGKATAALDRLNLILAQLSPENPRYEYDCVKVLCSLSNAANALGEKELAAFHLERAVTLLKEILDAPCLERTSLSIQLSELLVSINDLGQARYFAEAALQCLADCLQDCDTDEAAETLRRYAKVAKHTGELSSAYLALTVGLLAIQDLSGVESLIAADAAELTSLACKAAYPSALSRIGQALLLRAA